MLLCQCLVVLSHPLLESDRLESSSISLLFGKKWNMLPSTHINNHLAGLPSRLHSSWLYLKFIMVSHSLALCHDPGKDFSLYKVRRKIITCVIQQHASEVFQWPYWCFQFWWNNKMPATAQPTLQFMQTVSLLPTFVMKKCFVGFENTWITTLEWLKTTMQL